MAKRVPRVFRDCPKCGHINDEGDTACENCFDASRSWPTHFINGELTQRIRDLEEANRRLTAAFSEATGRIEAVKRVLEITDITDKEQRE